MTRQQTADVREMLIVHRVFRREFAALPEAIRCVPEGDHARTATVAGHADLILTGLHLHHEAEDEILWPLIASRAPTGSDLTERMEAQHTELASLIGRIEQLLPTWARFARNPEPLAQLFESLQLILLAHLAEEEAEILPLITAHVTAAEWAKVGAHARRHANISQLPLMFGLALEECDTDERALLLHVLPPPARLLTRPLIEPLYRRYITKVRAN